MQKENHKESNQELNALLDFLKRNRGFDFTGYKTNSLVRRIQKRMQAVGVEGYMDYIDYLEIHPDEFSGLFNTILINVTGFFRDPQTWTYLQENIIPKIIESKKPNETIRVWSTGCASGEEAYSIAMLLAEATGEENFTNRVKIYATDIDEEALAKARTGYYTEKEIEEVPEDLRQKYFVRTGSGFSFHKDLRHSIIFGRNDLIQDAPISRVDLLICRNTLMYFTAETQGKILNRFHFALRDSGYLFLGKAEMLLSHTSIFTPVDLKLRIFTKVPRINYREPIWMGPNDTEEDNRLYSMVQIRDMAFETNPIPHLILDSNNILILVNAAARTLFNLNIHDVGRPIQDLEISYRPVELRSVIDKALDDKNPVIIRNVEWLSNIGESRYFEIRIQALTANTNTFLGTIITYTDVTQHWELEKQLELTNHELESAFEELQSTNEELETTNEELQSTIEELETTNEELQSTNEELETMNEELQSTNEELHTMNDELRIRTEELNRVNAFMEAVMKSIQMGVVVLDRDLRVRAWNQKAEDLWGLREEEVRDQYFLNLDIGLPVEQLKKPLNNILTTGGDHQETVLTARNRRGRDVAVRVSSSPLRGKQGEVQGAILMMDQNA
jgi:two-component system CheB/CheR fusion protein